MKTSWNDFKEKLSEQAGEKGVAASGVFELTARCTLRCKMCYVSGAIGDDEVILKERTGTDWINLAREARDAGMLYILLTGGEVFLRKDFREIYEEITMMGLIPTIYTNATLVTYDVANWVSRRPPEAVDVTIYGASASTYKKVCGYEDGFERTVRGIDNLLAAGVDVRLKTTVLPDNAHDYEKLLMFAKERDLTLRFCWYISPKRYQSGKPEEIPRLNPKDLAAYMWRASRDFSNLKSKDNTSDNKKTAELEKQQISPFKCYAGTRSFFVNWEGQMIPCALMREPLTFPFEYGFQEAWKRLNEEVLKIPKCHTCISCSLKKRCLTCPVRLKTETGFYTKTADYLCELAREQIMLYPD